MIAMHIGKFDGGIARYCPVFICDRCDKQIKKEGSALWHGSRDGEAIYIVHKKCDTRDREKYPASMELDQMAIALFANLVGATNQKCLVQKVKHADDMLTI